MLNLNQLLESAVAKGFFEVNDCIIFYDLAALESRLCFLKSCFPKHTVHAVAVKANPLIKVLSFLESRGFAAEVASIGELKCAEHAGFKLGDVVFDSPAKTRQECELALQNGYRLNIDNFEELKRIDVLMEGPNTKSIIGLRINPQVGEGDILVTSVAGLYSKFGLPLLFQKDEIIASFLKYPFLSALHLHVGSQGCDVALLVEGVSRVFNLLKEINQALKDDGQDRQVHILDIGGGIPIAYQDADQEIKMDDYVNQLQKVCPDLFSDEIQIVTEFGRYLHAHNGVIVSKVEYVKDDGHYQTLVIHVGADLLARRCSHPDQWFHRISVFDSNGCPKTGDECVYTIAGPLCFAGDILVRDISLPHVEEGDLICVHDTGAYTFSMPSRYNSRLFPLCLGYHIDNEFMVLREKETIEEMLSFWGVTDER